MHKLMPFVSLIGLALVAVPPVVYLAGALEKGTMTTWMLVGTIVWFVSAPFVMNAKAQSADSAGS